MSEKSYGTDSLKDAFGRFGAYLKACGDINNQDKSRFDPIRNAIDQEFGLTEKEVAKYA